MKLIIAEKGTVAETIAHSVGAREKVFGDGKAMCYKGNDYYVAYAQGHLYNLGMPENYGYSKSFNIDELPMLPDEFKLFPCDENTDNLRKLITTLINKNEVTEIICATDAAREGELIFRHIYKVSGSTKPVKRLWINAMTDEAIIEGMNNLKPDSEYDGVYLAAYAREKSDWVFGFNLSRLYGSKDKYAHRVGRVKTALLNIIVERDNEIRNFVSRTSYKLKMDNGAISDVEYETQEAAMKQKELSDNKSATVIKVEKTEKMENRPLLYSLDSLQEDANEQYGFTANETLSIAQKLYESKFTTYPRTDSTHLPDNMKNEVVNIVNKFADVAEYAERVAKLVKNNLNLDKRIFDTSKTNDHHAIIPTGIIVPDGKLSENELKIYKLIVNRFLMSVDKKYRYTETHYEFWIEDVTYTLDVKKSIELGWKEYLDKELDEKDIPEYKENDVVETTVNVIECATQPKKHYTDGTLIRVMKNIDNRIEDKELKAAVKGKGIGTVATRAAMIEQLILADYIQRKGSYLVATDFGCKFIASLPSTLKSAERTAEWEQKLDAIQESCNGMETFYQEVVDFVKSIIAYEESDTRNREAVNHINSHAPEKKAIAVCPRCGKNIYEGILNYYCESGKDGCGYTLWKKSPIIKGEIKPGQASDLISGKNVKLTGIKRDKTEYTAPFVLSDDGKYVNLVISKSDKEPLGKCPRCGGTIYESKTNYYCDSFLSEKKCGFSLKKDDTYNGITISARNVKDLLNKGVTIIKKKKIDDSTISVKFEMVDTGKYINLVKKE